MSGTLYLIPSLLGEAAAVDVALTLALLAAFASFAFVKAYPVNSDDRTPPGDET